MVRIHISGLTVCYFQRSALKLLMLNAGAKPSLAVPHHIQTLIVPSGGWDPNPALTTIAPLPSLAGRLSRPDLEQGHSGWDLSGLTVRLNAGNGRPVYTEPDLGEYPPLIGTGPDRDWSGMHWVMKINRYAPTPTVIPTALTPGDVTTTVIDITGGSVEGGKPTNGEDSDWVWYFGHKAVQAVTDTLDFVAGAAITAELYRDSNRVGSIALTDGCTGYLINEATYRDQKWRTDTLKKLGLLSQPQALDYPAYRVAVNNVPSRAPVSVYNYASGNLFEGTFCLVLRIDE